MHWTLPIIVFNADFGYFIVALERIFEKADAMGHLPHKDKVSNSATTGGGPNQNAFYLVGGFRKTTKSGAASRVYLLAGSGHPMPGRRPRRKFS
jgi:hypothetical protein